LKFFTLLIGALSQPQYKAGCRWKSTANQHKKTLVRLSARKACNPGEDQIFNVQSLSNSGVRKPTNWILKPDTGLRSRLKRSVSGKTFGNLQQIVDTIPLSVYFPNTLSPVRLVADSWSRNFQRLGDHHKGLRVNPADEGFKARQLLKADERNLL